MKRYFMILCYIVNMALCAQYIGAMEHDDEQEGKKTVATFQRVAALSAVINGWGFFAVTSARLTHVPYWIKRAPLFGFLGSTTASQLPLIVGVHNQPTTLRAIGKWKHKTFA